MSQKIIQAQMCYYVILRLVYWKNAQNNNNNNRYLMSEDISDVFAEISVN